jgi:hypothetical protein
MTTSRRAVFGISAAAVSAGLLLLGSVIGVQAQDGSAGLTYTPTIIEEHIDPGESLPAAQSVLRVTNKSSEKQTLYVIKKDIEGITQDGVPVFADEQTEKTGFELSSWVTLGLESFEIGAGETKSVPFTISVPKDATPGSHFGAIFISREPVRPEAIGSGVGYGVAMPIVLRVAGDIVEEARIREFSTDKDIYSTPKVTFSVMVENPGNVLVRPRGPIEIFDFFDRKVATVIMNDDPPRAVFPGAQREFTLFWQGERFSFGRYEATLALDYGDESHRTVSSVTSFWVLPLGIILPVFAVLFALVLGVVVFVKIQVRRRLKQMGVAGPAGRTESPIMPKSAPFSKLVFITIAMLLCTLVFLVLMFIFFA